MANNPFMYSRGSQLVAIRAPPSPKTTRNVRNASLHPTRRSPPSSTQNPPSKFPLHSHNISCRLPHLTSCTAQLKDQRTRPLLPPFFLYNNGPLTTPPCLHVACSCASCLTHSPRCGGTRTLDPCVPRVVLAHAYSRACTNPTSTPHPHLVKN